MSGRPRRKRSHEDGRGGGADEAIDVDASPTPEDATDAPPSKKRPRPPSPEPYVNHPHAHAQLPSYLSEAFSELYAEDGLAVLGRGLGWLELLCTFVRYYGDRSEEGYAASLVDERPGKSAGDDDLSQGRKPPLIFVLGLREEERRVLESTLTSWGTPTNELPQVVVSESGLASERAALYARGGIFVITSRILIVDLLQGTAHAKDIAGMLVAHAERVVGDGSTEAFILRIFRNHRTFLGGSGGFIKAFTDDPASLVSGFAKTEKILKSLQVKKMYLYPRFHAAVADELERQPPKVLELHQPLSQSMKDIQLNLAASIRACLRDLKAKCSHVDWSFLSDATGSKGKRKRDAAFDYDPHAKRSRVDATHDWKFTIQQCLSTNFSHIIQRQLDGDWHNIGRDAKQAISDLKDLGRLFTFLIEYDCAQFFMTLQGYKAKSSSSKYPSYWMMQGAGEKVFSLAKERVYRVIPDPTNPKGGRLKQILEEKPKERLLHQVMTEVQNRWNAKLQKAREGGSTITSSSANVLLMVKDETTLKSVEAFLASGGGKIASARSFLRYLDQVDAKTKPMLGAGGHNLDTLPTEQRLLYEEHSKVRKVVKGDGSYKDVLEVDKKKLSDWKKKHRRVIEEKARGMANADAIRQQGLLEEAVEEARGDSNAPAEPIFQTIDNVDGSDDNRSIDSWSSEDEDELACKVEPIEGLRLFIRTFSKLGEGEATLLLNDLQPTTVVMYDSSPSFIRSLEIYSNTMDDPTSPTPLAEEDRLQVFFLRYAGSSEAINFDKTIEREKDAFDRLIDHKKRMPTALPSFNNFSSQEMQLARGGVGGSYAGGTLPLSMDTRTGGGKQNTSKDRRDIAVDVREFRSPLPSILHQGGMRLAPVQLIVGDFVLSNVHCVERKSLSDLFQSMNSGRLYHQAEIMCKHYKCPCLLIEFDPQKTFCLQSKSDLGGDIRKDAISSKLTMLTMEFPKLRLLWSRSPHETLKIFKKLKRNHQEVDVDKAVEIGTNESLDELLLGGEDGYYNDEDNEGSNDAAKQMLLRLPGVNVHNARKIMSECDSIAELAELSREELRRIAGPVAGQKLFTFFRKRFAS